MQHVPNWIALLRGINVGGRHVLPMRDLMRILEKVGCRDVKTYIQSGNVVFRTSRRDASRLARIIGDEIDSQFGFRPMVVLLTAAELERAIEANPFPEAESDPSKLHLLFLVDSEQADLDRLEALRAKSERFELLDGVLYLHAPEGIGRSKLAAQAERALGAPATGRNWRTIEKLAELAKDQSTIDW